MNQACNRSINKPIDYIILQTVARSINLTLDPVGLPSDPVSLVIVFQKFGDTILKVW
jgi:hypothetical protein